MNGCQSSRCQIIRACPGRTRGDYSRLPGECSRVSMIEIRWEVTKSIKSGRRFGGPAWRTVIEVRSVRGTGEPETSSKPDQHPITLRGMATMSKPKKQNLFGKLAEEACDHGRHTAPRRSPRGLTFEFLEERQLLATTVVSNLLSTAPAVVSQSNPPHARRLHHPGQGCS